MWYIHGHINFALISGAALSDFYDEVMQPDDPTEAYQILQGYHTRPVDAAHGLWDLSRKVKAQPDALSQLFAEHKPKELVAKLGESDEGRAFLADLDEYLFDFGWRSDAVYDLNDVPWIEQPSIPLGNIARYVPMDDSEDPMIKFNEAVKRREDLTAKIRAKLAYDPEKLGQVRGAVRRRQVRLPTHRGPRVLHRPDGRRALPPLRPHARRVASRARLLRRRLTTSCISTTARSAMRSRTTPTTAI